MNTSSIISASAYARRRRRLARLIKSGILVLQASPPRARSRDVDGSYHPCPYFRYLTGMSTPDCALVMSVADGAIAQEILYCPPRDRLREQWEGKMMSPAQARRLSGCATIRSAHDFARQVEALLAAHRDVFFEPEKNPEFDRQLLSLVSRLRAQNRSAVSNIDRLHDVRRLIDPMRLVKDSEEVQAIEHCAAITGRAFDRVAAMIRSATNENEIAATIEAAYIRAGATGAFPSIVAGGHNALTLHYSANNRRFKKSDLVLIDSGAQYAGYCADVTRTIPAGGKFQPAARDVYDIVLSAQVRAIDRLHRGGSFADASATALRTLVAGLKSLKLLSGTTDSIIRRGAYRRFYMHRLGHWLGMDVHDVGAVPDDPHQPLALKKGMVLTVEPGLYIPNAPDIPKALRGIGVRIEDDVLITQRGVRVLTEAIPKRAEAVEAWIQ